MGGFMKICIRAHDLGVKGTQQILQRIRELGIDGVQMVCYKAYDDISYSIGAVTEEKAASIQRGFSVFLLFISQVSLKTTWWRH